MKLKSLLGGAALAASMACALAASSAQAKVITYQFTSGSEYSNGADTASLSGDFSWDTVSKSIVASDITLSGYDATGSRTGSVSCSDCSTGIYDGAGYHYALNLGPQALYVTFANSLSAGGSDALSLYAIEGNGAEYQGGRPFRSVSGAAVAVPEPATWAMMLLGFGAMGYALRKRRQRGGYAFG